MVLIDIEYGAVHGICMNVAFLVLSQVAEIVAVFVHAKTNINQGYFQAYEQGRLLFNVHRILMILSFLLSIVGLIIIGSSPNFFSWFLGVKHVIYGIIMLCAFFLQIGLRLAFPGPATKPFHRWFGRAISLWGFLTSWEGFAWIDGPESDGFPLVYGCFGVFYSIKCGIYLYYKIAHYFNKAKKYDPPGQAAAASPPAVAPTAADKALEIETTSR